MATHYRNHDVPTRVSRARARALPENRFAKEITFTRQRQINNEFTGGRVTRQRGRTENSFHSSSPLVPAGLWWVTTASFQSPREAGAGGGGGEERRGCSRGFSVRREKRRGRRGSAAAEEETFRRFSQSGPQNHHREEVTSRWPSGEGRKERVVGGLLCRPWDEP